MIDRRPRSRGEDLADRMMAAGDDLLGLLDDIDAEAWDRVRRPDEWSPGKDAEHVADAAALHLWSIRRSLGEGRSEPPPVERATMTAGADRQTVIARVRAATTEAAGVLRDLTEAQLELPVQPPRANGERVGHYIERVLIRHVRTHREAIATKARRR